MLQFSTCRPQHRPRWFDFDSDHDGSALDDIASMACKYMTTNNTVHCFRLTAVLHFYPANGGFSIS